MLHKLGYGPITWAACPLSATDPNMGWAACALSATYPNTALVTRRKQQNSTF